MDTTFQDHYETLGVPVGADQAEIRRAFRRKVRELHPDVAKDKANATEAFLKVKEAYSVLSDPGRRTTYDLQRANYRARQRTKARPSQRPAGAGASAGAQQLSVPELLQRAMRALGDGRFGFARRDLLDVLRREPLNPDALVLMGRLYHAEGRIAEWIRTLEDGVQANPSHLALRLALHEARKAAETQSRASMVTPDDLESRRRGYMAAGISGAALAFLWAIVRGGAPIGALQWATQAPAPLIIGGMLSAAFAGWTMAAAGISPPVDEELFFADTHWRPARHRHKRQDSPPLGLAVPMLALIHYSLAVVVIALLMVSRMKFSRSLATVAGLAFVMSLGLAGARAEHAATVMVWCPGWLLFAEFAGWFVGDLFRI